MCLNVTTPEMKRIAQVCIEKIQILRVFLLYFFTFIASPLHLPEAFTGTNIFLHASHGSNIEELLSPGAVLVVSGQLIKLFRQPSSSLIN